MIQSTQGRWTNQHPNLVPLRPGDIVKAFGGMAVVVAVNDCNARVKPIGADRKKTVTTRFGKSWEVTEKAKVEAIAADYPPEEIVERRGKEWLEQFLKATAPRLRAKELNGAEQSTTETNERNDSMPRKAKGESKPRDRRKDRGGLAAEAAGTEAKPKRARKPREPGSTKLKGRGDRVQELLAAGKDDETVWTTIKAEFPASDRKTVGKIIETRRARIEKQEKEQKAAA